MSDPGWSDPASGGAPQPLPAGRYRIDGVLGRGGMGEVFLAWDRHLEREVAYKRVRPERGATDARLLAEARVAASLDHPGVVPILDVGEEPGGALFYTMRRVRGRTLAELDAPLPQRLRHLLDVVGAIAHAHGRGVVHGDLKPSNVMVGPDGETQVLDWGLAGPVDRADRRGGTAKWLPPEGPGPGFGGDVYALGATIAAVVTRRDGRWREVAGQIDDPALRAIALRALADAPGDRYPSARELAADLVAYVDGGWVGAHDYAWTERIALWARRWRWPLRVAGAALAAGAGVAAIAAWRVVAERDRALSAEAAAVAARADAQATLAASLARQATLAVAANQRPAAEILAAHALALGDAPRARGARMAFAAQAVPTVVDVDVGCPERAAVGPDGWWCAGAAVGLPHAAPVAIPDLEAHARGGDGLWLATSYTTTWRGPGGDGPAVPGTGLFVPGGLRAARIEQAVVVVMDTTGARREVVPCADQAYRLGAWDAEGLWVLCRERRAVRIGLDGATRAVAIPGLPSEVHALAVAAGNAYIGVGGGELLVVDLATGGVTARLDPRVGRIRGVAAAPDGQTLTAWGADPGTAVLIDGVLVLRLPVDGPDVAPEAGRRLAIGGARPVRVDLAGVAPVTLREAVGLSHAAATPDGRALALGLADGRVAVWDAGHRAAWPLVADRVPKAVAFDGEALWTAVSGHALPFGRRWVDGAPLPAPPTSRPDLGCRRIVVVDGPWCVTYDSVDPVAFDGRPAAPAPRPWVDASQSGPEVAVLLDEAGEVATFAGGTVTRVATVPGALRVDVSADGARIVAADRRALRVLDATGATLRTIPAIDDVWDVALSPDGAWVAAGGLSGATAVWRVADGGLVAVLDGVHTERVATVLWTPDALITAGWDGRAHRWGLGPLVADETPAVAEARWRRRLADVVAE